MLSVVSNLLAGATLFFSYIRLEIIQFDTLPFVFFVLFGVILYYLTKRNQLVLLLICVTFYIFFSVSMTKIIAVLALVNYLLGIILYFTRRRSILVLGVMINLGMLLYFKYANFFLTNINELKIFGHYQLIYYVVIPLGISFFTFELLHYLIDVYKGEKPIYNMIDFFIFIFFFPTLIAGPIKRYEQFIPQLKKKVVNWDILEDGVFLLLKGLFKKVVIANALAITSSRVFDNPAGSIATIIGIYAFTFQIYFDFSGYTDIGRGIAALFMVVPFVKTV